MENSSSTNPRPILPRPATITQTNQSPTTTSDLTIPRKIKVATACQSCKLKKTKCDGDRPECGPCAAKGRTCEYPAPTNRAEDLVKRQQALQENVESFAALYRYLQERPTNEAKGLFERIRNGFGIEAALEFVTAEENNAASTSIDPPSARLEWSQQIYDCNLLFENELLSSETSDLAIQALRDGVDCYFFCLGTMFPIYTRKEIDLLSDTFIASQEAEVRSRKIAYGELLAICAVGFQYDRQTLPNGNASICTPFYQKARLFLDYVVEEAPLRAMRICCCLGIYNVIAKSSLAISYTDWGILLGSSSGLDVGKRPPDLSEEEFKGYRKTFTALITVRSWVTATLGNIPSPEVSKCIHETRERMDNTEALDPAGEDTVLGILQHKMAQITFLKANVLRTVASFRVLSPAILRQIHEDLGLWQSSLPPYLRLEALVHMPEISPDQRRVAFYMHLFYMSALILKTRALLAAQKDPSSCNWDPAVTAAILGGINAARDSARLLKLIYDENAVVKNCWLIMIARSFHTRLMKYRDVLKEHLPEAADDRDESHEGECRDDDSYLFIESGGNTRLHHLMDELRKMLCYPLTLLNEGSEAKIPYPTIVQASITKDINFVHHLASPFNMAEDEVPNGLFPPEERLEETNGYRSETEGYVSGSVPFGWDVSAWTRDPGVGNAENA
ncbi:nitrate assimilation regulatory nirA [Fusarium beomiforme]|uniref:Nitrate assimilation regulatory nirA n=1 Tax=Fusarium beomiforme TaxID=44412 RepID=A0A9P5DXC9_9HYPO|nr:nitrate assimilation regulatory nirA [Fusarium beomiforme]